MVDRTLADFVKEALGKGASRADIERALAEAGWPPDQIKGALSGYAEVDFPTPVPLPRAYISAREAFLYLVLFIVLGVFASHLGGLLFALVDVFLPRDAMASISLYEIRRASGAIRWSVSALAVALPLFFLLTWRLGRARRRNTAMQGSRIRKWVTYITLVIAAATLIGDLIAVVYSLLAGELSLRFMLKALAIAAIAGAIFIYYVRDAEREEEAGPTPLLDRAIGLGAAVVAIVGSIAGVAVVESPAELRARERDNTRLTAITEIAGAADCYYTYEGEVPESLNAMRVALNTRAAATPLEYSCVWVERTDPATGGPYEYRAVSEDTFEVCATFDRESDEFETQQSRTYSWRAERGYRTLNAVHGAGRHCFTLTAESLAAE